ncbi:hypothetical protein LIER_32726 [Lithospermum erythrorhizon]|uniref:Uncharacterized protein n=1 Tax=Lithospermum erythrorhizon TaxID=34254 RepID=A0AAV3RWF2_LITER
MICVSQFRCSASLCSIRGSFIYKHLKHLLNYVHNTPTQGIILKESNQLSLQAFSNFDWAACPSTRRSITGYVVTLGGCPISWKSKK